MKKNFTIRTMFSVVCIGLLAAVVWAKREKLNTALEKSVGENSSDSTGGKVESAPSHDSVTRRAGLHRRAAQRMGSGKFAEAAELYEEITVLEPRNGVAWFRLGYCLHGAGDLDKAIEIHKKAATFGGRFQPVATYNLACAYSLQNKADEAFAALEQAIDLGFNNAQQLTVDSDLDNLRDDERFVKISKRLAGNNE